MLTFNRVWRADNRDGAELVDAAARLLDRQPYIMHRDLRGELEALRITLAIIVSPIVVRARQCRRVIRREIVVTQDLPPARAVHHGNIDALDIHRRQGRGRIEALRPRDIEMRVTRSAFAPQLTAGGGRPLRLGERRDRQPLHLHASDSVGVAFVLGTLRQRLLLSAKEARRVRSMRLVEIAGPQVVRLHHVQITVQNQVAFACHCFLL